MTAARILCDSFGSAVEGMTTNDESNDDFVPGPAKKQKNDKAQVGGATKRARKPKHDPRKVKPIPHTDFSEQILHGTSDNNDNNAGATQQSSVESAADFETPSESNISRIMDEAVAQPTGTTGSISQVNTQAIRQTSSGTAAGATDQAGRSGSGYMGSLNSNNPRSNPLMNNRVNRRGLNQLPRLSMPQRPSNELFHVDNDLNIPNAENRSALRAMVREELNDVRRELIRTISSSVASIVSAAEESIRSSSQAINMANTSEGHFGTLAEQLAAIRSTAAGITSGFCTGTRTGTRVAMASTSRDAMPSTSRGSIIATSCVAGPSTSSGASGRRSGENSDAEEVIDTSTREAVVISTNARPLDELLPGVNIPMRSMEDFNNFMRILRQMRADHMNENLNQQDAYQELVRNFKFNFITRLILISLLLFAGTTSPHLVAVRYAEVYITTCHYSNDSRDHHARTKNAILICRQYQN